MGFGYHRAHSYAHRVHSCWERSALKARAVPELGITVAKR